MAPTNLLPNPAPLACLPPAQAYVFAAPAVKQQVHAELSSWWPSASAAHSPVLLAWAAVLCLISKSGEGGRGGGGADWERHAGRAHETDALGTLCRLTAHAGLQPNAAEMFNNIVLRWVGEGGGAAWGGAAWPASGMPASAFPRLPVFLRRQLNSICASSLPLILCLPPACSTMSAAFCAFNFSAAALPLPQLELVAGILGNLFRWG